MSENSITYEEMADLIDLVDKFHGYDFSDYAEASLKRRFSYVMSRYNLNFFDLKYKLVNDKGFFSAFLNHVTVNVTEMFRDPSFYTSLKDKVLPYLASFPNLKIWTAGCASGEETYSLAILLKESGLLNKSFLYGTDINEEVLEVAKEGIYPAVKMKDYSANYLLYGGSHSLSDYYHANYNSCIINNELRKKVLFSNHNLAIDSGFNEFHMISCRNVLIYFQDNLRLRVLNLLTDCLCDFGFLCLGSKESLRNAELEKRYRIIDKTENIYQKIA